jgi:hypothetical protein
MPSSDYRPSIEDVGARMFARTLDSNGNRRTGTFSATTLPSATAVDTLIDDALSTVEAAVGRDLDGDFLATAKTAVVYNTAMLIELSYFPESTESGDSAYKAYEARYEDVVKHLKDAINMVKPGDKRIVSLRMESPVRLPGNRLDPWANDLFPVVMPLLLFHAPLIHALLAW